MIVYTRAGYAIDRGWLAETTVWSWQSDASDRLVTRHRLDRAPPGEADAAAVARRWWHREGPTGVHRNDQRKHGATRIEEAR